MLRIESKHDWKGIFVIVISYINQLKEWSIIPTVNSQAAALKKLGPGSKAEEVHAEYAEVIQSTGYEYPFRCGRATGFSFLEKPQLVFGDKTILQPGMVLAVDGSVTDSKNSFRAQVGDSFIITESGYEPITHFSKDLVDVVL